MSNCSLIKKQVCTDSYLVYREHKRRERPNTAAEPEL
jgi:hypothetical protein